MDDAIRPPAVAQPRADDLPAAVLPVSALQRADPRTVMLAMLTVLAVFYTFWFASGIVLPLLFACVLNLVLAPVKRLLTDRLNLPAPLAAAVLILGLFALVSGIVALVSVPATTWIAKAPQSLPQLQQRLGFLAEPIAFFRHGVDQVQNLMQQTPKDGAPVVSVQQPSTSGGVGLSILEGTRAALGQVITMAVVLFSLLASGNSLLRRLVEIVPTFGEKRRVVEIASEIEQNISNYLFTITAMNALVGLACGVSMWAQGIPDAALWGTLAFLLNYIPILGPCAGMVIFFFVGLFSTPTLWQAALPPAIYLVIHVMEGQTATPLLLARRFTLNPVILMVSLFFWDWLWGVAGAFLAVPLLAIAKIVADRIPTLAPLGHLLGGPPRGAAKAS